MAINNRAAGKHMTSLTEATEHAYDPLYTTDNATYTHPVPWHLDCCALPNEPYGSCDFTAKTLEYK